MFRINILISGEQLKTKFELQLFMTINFNARKSKTTASISTVYVTTIFMINTQMPIFQQREAKKNRLKTAYKRVKFQKQNSEPSVITQEVVANQGY